MKYDKNYSIQLTAKVDRVIAVGVGEADMEELKLIANKPSDENVIYVDDFADLQNEVLKLGRWVSVAFPVVYSVYTYFIP